MKKKKNKKVTKPQVSVMSVLLGDLPDRSPVVQNSGKNLVSDRSVARVNDYLKGNQKDDAWTQLRFRISLENYNNKFIRT